MKRFLLILVLFPCLMQSQWKGVVGEIFFTGQPDTATMRGYGFQGWVKNAGNLFYENQATGGSPPYQTGLLQGLADSYYSNRAKLHMDTYWADVEYMSTTANNWAGYGVSLAACHTNADSLAKMIGILKARQPSMRVGLYSLVPSTKVWSGGDDVQWHTNTDTLRALAESLEVISPSVYLYKDYHKGATPWVAYRTFMGRMIRESQRIAPGKPVYPFMSPCYHDSNDYADSTAWYKILQSAKDSGATGIVMFAGNGAMRPIGAVYGDWATASTSGWWGATKAFMANNPPEGEEPPTVARMNTLLRKR